MAKSLTKKLVTFWIDKKALKEVKDVALTSTLSESEIYRQAINEWLQNHNVVKNRVKVSRTSKMIKNIKV